MLARMLLALLLLVPTGSAVAGGWMRPVPTLERNRPLVVRVTKEMPAPPDGVRPALPGVEEPVLPPIVVPPHGRPNPKGPPTVEPSPGHVTVTPPKKDGPPPLPEGKEGPVTTPLRDPREPVL